MSEMVKVRYKGLYRVICRMPGFQGYLNPGDIAPTTKDNYENSLKNHDEWELAKEPEKPKKKEKEVNADG